jgi:flagellar biosynthetic protein FliO
MEPVSIMSSFFSMIFALAVILGLLLGAVYLLKRFLPNTAPGFADNSLIQVISARYIGPKSSVMIVEILGKVVVIGVSADNLSYITEITGEEAMEKLKAVKAQSKAMPSLSNYMKKNEVFGRMVALVRGRGGRLK